MGEVVDEPSTASDGDPKLNLRLNPLWRGDVQAALTTHLTTNQGMLTTADPVIFPAAQFPGGVPDFTQRISRPTWTRCRG